jgi:hypothetical protein
MPVSTGRACGIAACALVSLSAPPAAQKTKAPEPPPEVDPYTGGDPERLARLGYRSLGPFRFGTTSSEIVQAHLGHVPIQWVETEHFRLGSALAEYRPERSEEIAELKLELERLRERLPGFPSSSRKLDPWLRLHLFARRLESLCEDFCARMGVAWRVPGGEEPAGPGGASVLAMPEKFTVLLTQKRSMLARFTGEYCGEERDDNSLHYFTASGSLFFGVSDDSVALSDSDLHYAVVYGVAENLLMGINGYPHWLPSWWQNGVALWFARDREPRILCFSRPEGETLPPDEFSDWEPLVRARVEAGACLGWNEMLARPSWIDQRFGENVVLWSRIDWLLRREAAALPLVNALHEASPSMPDSVAALKRATGLELEALDRAWRDWVKQTYRKKRR